MSDADNRRPLTSRNARWAQNLARRIAATSVTPNRISIASIVAAAVAFTAFWASAYVGGAGRVVLLLLAATFCQIRLLCNLMDGLVAIEGGKRTADGPFWNECPDRASDMLILVGVGMATGAPALGWVAAAMAILTAYVRELGHTCGAPADYSGPMAKPQRMAVVTVAAVLAIFEPLLLREGWILWLALWIVVLGAAWTALRRSTRILAHLNRGQRD